MVYKELSSDEESFHDVDSSLNETLEPENIEDEKRLFKNKPVEKRLDELTEGLAGCKLDGSAIVFEDLDEVVEEGLVVEGPEAELKMPNDPPPPVQVDFEDENSADGARALENSRTLKMEFNYEEVEFWFTQLENEMYACEVKSQWMKRSILVRNLPIKIQNDVKSLLVLKQTTAPADIYKKIRKEVMRIYAPKEEETFKKALGRVLVGLPSQLGQQLINDICSKPVKLVGCCCAKAVYTLWCLQLPLNLRSQIADRTFDHTSYEEIFQSADKIYLSTQTTDMSANVAAIVTPANPPKAAGAAEVSAVKSSKPPKQNKPNNSNNGGNSNSSKPRPTVPEGCCSNHRKWAANAWFCLDPTKCPMATQNVPRPPKKNNNK